MTGKQSPFDRDVADLVQEIEARVDDLVSYFEAEVPPFHERLTPADVRAILSALVNPEASPAEQQHAKDLVAYQFELAQERAAARQRQGAG